MTDLDQLEALAKAAPSGKWEVWTSNSWRRVFADQGRDKMRVIEPTTHPFDKHPDLMFGPGVAEWLEGFTPEVALALIAEVRALREDKARLDYMDAARPITFCPSSVGDWWTLYPNHSSEVCYSGKTLREAIDAARKEKA